jgi:hypothetical protein
VKSRAPSAQVHVIDAGHFALDEAADQIAFVMVYSSTGSGKFGVKPRL